ncbi:MAG: hypothetical protein R3F18_00325 [Lysobacterales bacterium]
MPKPVTLLTLSLIWSSLVVWPGGSEALKVTGIALASAWLIPWIQISTRRRALWPLLGVMMAALAAALLALEPSAALIGSHARAQGLLIAMAVVILALAASTCTEAERCLLYRRAALLGAAVSTYALLQRVGLDPIHWDTPTDHRPAATLGNATTLAGWLILLLPPSLLNLRSGASRLWWIPVGLQLTALLLTQSRSAVLALTLAGLALWLLWNPRRLRLGVPLLLMLLLAAVVLAAWRPASLHDRAYLWRIAAQALTDPQPVLDAQGQSDRRPALRPWFGYGPDQQQSALDNVGRAGTGARSEALSWAADRAHQGLLDGLLETGLFGLVSSLILIWAVACALRRGLDVGGSRRQEAAALGLALAAWLLHLQASFALSGDRSLAWVWIGCALGLVGNPGRTSDASVPGLVPRFGGMRMPVMGLLLLGALAAAQWLPARLQQQLAPALASQNEFVAGQQHYLQALAAAPGESAALLRASAQAFERAAELRPHDRDAAFAAASAWVETAAAAADPVAMERAHLRTAQLQQSARGDPRLAPLTQRVSAVEAQLRSGDPSLPPSIR